MSQYDERCVLNDTSASIDYILNKVSELKAEIINVKEGRFQLKSALACVERIKEIAEDTLDSLQHKNFESGRFCDHITCNQVVNVSRIHSIFQRTIIICFIFSVSVADGEQTPKTR